MPALASELFGLSHFGLNYCLIGNSITIISFLVSNMLVGALNPAPDPAWSSRPTATCTRQCTCILTQRCYACRAAMCTRPASSSMETRATSALEQTASGLPPSATKDSWHSLLACDIAWACYLVTAAVRRATFLLAGCLEVVAVAAAVALMQRTRSVFTGEYQEIVQEEEAVKRSPATGHRLIPQRVVNAAAAAQRASLEQT